MRILVVAALVLALMFGAAGAAGPENPFKTFNDVGKAIDGQSVACNGTLYKLSLGDSWDLFLAENRALFVHYAAGGDPDYVYLAPSVEAGKDIVITEVLSIDAAKQRYPTPCDFFPQPITGEKA